MSKDNVKMKYYRWQDKKAAMGGPMPRPIEGILTIEYEVLQLIVESDLIDTKKILKDISPLPQGGNICVYWSRNFSDNKHFNKFELFNIKDLYAIYSLTEITQEQFDLEMSYL